MRGVVAKGLRLAVYGTIWAHRDRTTPQGKKNRALYQRIKTQYKRG